MKRISSLLLTMAFVGTASGSVLAAGTPPAILEVRPTQIGPTSAAMRMTYDTKGQNSRVWFEYSKNANFSGAQKFGEHVIRPDDKQTHDDIGGLLPGTEYFYRAYIRNYDGEAYSHIASFRTETKFEPPEINFYSMGESGGKLIVGFGYDSKGSKGTVSVLWSTSSNMAGARTLDSRAVSDVAGGEGFNPAFPLTAVPDNTRVYFQAVITTAKGTAKTGVHDYLIRNKPI